MFEWTVPASVIPVSHVGLQLDACPAPSSGTPLQVGWYTGDPAAATLSTPLTVGTSCYAILLSPPAGALAGGVLRFYVRIPPSASPVPLGQLPPRIYLHALGLFGNDYLLV